MGKHSVPSLLVAYTPKTPLGKLRGVLAVRKGLEPSTSGVTGRHSNQLNYRTMLVAFCRKRMQIYGKFSVLQIFLKNIFKF